MWHVFLRYPWQFFSISVVLDSARACVCVCMPSTHAFWIMHSGWNDKRSNDERQQQQKNCQHIEMSWVFCVCALLPDRNRKIQMNCVSVSATSIEIQYNFLFSPRSSSYLNNVLYRRFIFSECRIDGWDVKSIYFEIVMVFDFWPKMKWFFLCMIFHPAVPLLFALPFALSVASVAVEFVAFAIDGPKP